MKQGAIEALAEVLEHNRGLSRVSSVKEFAVQLLLPLLKMFSKLSSSAHRRKTFLTSRSDAGPTGFHSENDKMVKLVSSARSLSRSLVKKDEAKSPFRLGKGFFTGCKSFLTRSSSEFKTDINRMKRRRKDHKMFRARLAKEEAARQKRTEIQRQNTAAVTTRRVESDPYHDRKWSLGETYRKKWQAKRRTVDKYGQHQKAQTRVSKDNTRKKERYKAPLAPRGSVEGFD